MPYDNGINFNGILTFTMLRRTFLSIVGLSLILLANLANSAEQVDIFSIEVPVKSQSQFFRNQAMRIGLSEVLVRASGRDDSLKNDYIISNLSKANVFVQQFAYLKSAEASSEYPWVLKMSFEDIVIQRLLADAGLPLWSETRPIVLLWLAQQDTNGREIVKKESLSADAVSTEAKRRAIPLRFPLMDAEDSNLIEFTDVWGRFASPIKTASKRYNAEVVVFGRIYERAGQWHSDWQMILENQRSGWNSQADTKEEASQLLFAEIGRRLCDKYCVLSTELSGNELLLRVAELDNLIEAASAEKYLLSLLPVRDINLVSLEGNQALFKLRLVSREQAVLEAIALDSALAPLPNPTSTAAEQRIYNYRWTP